jgi:eukaryotic-like serine/threonine-protein kinase
MALGTSLSLQGKPREALAQFQRALPLRIKAFGPEHPDTAAAYNNIGAAFHRMDQPAEAIENTKRANEIWAKALGDHHPETANSTLNLGIMLLEAGHPRDAESYIERTLAVREAALGPGHRDVGAALDVLSSIQLDLGKYTAALKTLARANAIFEKAMGADSPEVAHVLMNEGIAEGQLGHLAESLELFKRSATLYERKVGKDSPQAAEVQMYVATTLDQLGRTAESLPLHQRVMAADTSAERDLDLSRECVAFGDWHAKQEKWPEALALYRRAISLREKDSGPNSPKLTEALVGAANAQLAVGDARGAVSEASRARALAQAAENPPDTMADIGFVLARALWAAGDHAQALAEAQTAADNYRASPRRQELEEVSTWLKAHAGAKPSP